MDGFSDNFCVRFSNGKSKMAAKFGGHFVKNNRKPDFLSGFGF
jgi:hypothetical protein